MQDFDMLFYSTNPDFKGTSADTWARHIGSGVEKLGLEPNPGNQLEGWIRDAGFVNVKAHLLPMPVGSWPKEYKLVRPPLHSTFTNALCRGTDVVGYRNKRARLTCCSCWTALRPSRCGCSRMCISGMSKRWRCYWRRSGRTC